MSFYSDFAEHYETVFPFRERVAGFLSTHLSGPDRRVLDIGCGSGHYCGWLADHGHRAVGIDSDPEMIATARRYYPEPEFQVLDMASVGTLATGFDLAFCIGNVAAHLPRADLPAFLADLFDLLSPGGIWVFQVVNWDRILGETSFVFPDRELAEGLVFRREYRAITPEGLRFLTRLEAADRTLFAGEVTLHPVPAAEFLRRHEEAGFVLVGHHGDYLETPFDPARSGAAVYLYRRP